MAAADYSQAIKLDSGNSAAFAGRACAYNWLGQPEKAISDSQQAIKLNPRDTEAYVQYAAALAEQKKFENSIEACNQAIKLLPQNVQACMIRSFSQTGLGQYQKLFTQDLPNIM
jgi:tetratricopeptide (TPR) repeat protein